MKQRLQGVLLGVVLAALLLGSVTAAASSRTMDVTFGVNVVVDGVRQNFAPDMQPFTAEGRTFLPVRAIADALCMEVVWDEATSTVYLTSPSAAPAQPPAYIATPAAPPAQPAAPPQPVAPAFDGHMQLAPPQPGDTMVTLHTGMGDITIRMFPDEAPLAYENFVTHARNGYYDGTIFHRVIPGFMIQGGDPLGTGTGGESIWGEPFGPEHSTYLRHFRGALAMAQSALPNSIGSQFYIVQDDSIEEINALNNLFTEIMQAENEVVWLDANRNPVYLHDLFTQDILDAYRELGGTPHLDLPMLEIGVSLSGHTVFGQVWEGMEVVDRIANAQTGQGDRPVDDVVIESTTVFSFGN